MCYLCSERQPYCFGQTGNPIVLCFVKRPYGGASDKSATAAEAGVADSVGINPISSKYTVSIADTNTDTGAFNL